MVISHSASTMFDRSQTWYEQFRAETEKQVPRYLAFKAFYDKYLIECARYVTPANTLMRNSRWQDSSKAIYRKERIDFDKE